MSEHNNITNIIVQFIIYTCRHLKKNIYILNIAHIQTNYK